MHKNNLTNPEHHDPDNFMYIVHGIMGCSGCVDEPIPTVPDVKLDLGEINFGTADISDISKIDLTTFYECIGNFSYDAKYFIDGGMSQTSNISNALRKVQDPNDFYSASLVGRLSQERMRRIFGSWGDRDISQLATFGTFGLILQPEDTDVWIAWDNDIGTPDDKEKRRDFAHKHKGKKKSWIDLLQTPLSYSKQASYNELVINGNPNTSIVGLFYTSIDEKSESTGKHLAQRTMDLLKRHLPVIPIPLVEDEEDQSENPETREKMRELRHLQMTCRLYESQEEFEHYFERFRQHGIQSLDFSNMKKSARFIPKKEK